MAEASTVFYVEDDGVVRNALAQALWSRGFRAFVTENGNEAPRLLAPEPVDVLLANVVMPELAEIELVKHARLLHPRLRVMLTTGYFSRAAEGRSVAKLLFKPLQADYVEHQRVLVGEVVIELRLARASCRHHIVEARPFHAMRIDQIRCGLDDARASRRASGGQGAKFGFLLCARENALHRMDLTVQMDRRMNWTS